MKTESFCEASVQIEPGRCECGSAMIGFVRWKHLCQQTLYTFWWWNQLRSNTLQHHRIVPMLMCCILRLQRQKIQLQSMPALKMTVEHTKYWTCHESHEILCMQRKVRPQTYQILRPPDSWWQLWHSKFTNRLQKTTPKLRRKNIHIFIILIIKPQPYGLLRSKTWEKTLKSRGLLNQHGQGVEIRCGLAVLATLAR